jgi:hypothetical protein
LLRFTKTGALDHRHDELVDGNTTSDQWFFNSLLDNTNPSIFDAPIPSNYECCTRSLIVLGTQLQPLRCRDACWPHTAWQPATP